MTEMREALARLDPLWDELFPAERRRSESGEVTSATSCG